MATRGLPADAVDRVRASPVADRQELRFAHVFAARLGGG